MYKHNSYGFFFHNEFDLPTPISTWNLHIKPVVQKIRKKNTSLVFELYSVKSLFYKIFFHKVSVVNV